MLKFKQNHEVNLLLDPGACDAYDAKRMDGIVPEQVHNRTFSSRESRKIFLAGLTLGLEHARARLLSLDEVAIIYDMDDMKQIQENMAEINGVV